MIYILKYLREVYWCTGVYFILNLFKNKIDEWIKGLISG